MRLASFGPWAHRYVFFNNVFFLKFTTYSRRHTKTERKPMRVHSSQRRPTQAHKEENGPNDARRIVWAGIGKFFLMYFFLMYNLSTKAHEGPQQPTKPNAGPQRRKESPRRPTAANEGRRRPGLNIIIDLSNVDVYIYICEHVCNP